MKKSGFTLIELMVAMVVGLTAITSVYSLGSAMSRQFYEEQRTATAQGTSRVAIMELRRDISRAGLFGSPNGSLEPTCDSDAAEPSVARWRQRPDGRVSILRRRGPSGPRSAEPNTGRCTRTGFAS